MRDKIMVYNSCGNPQYGSSTTGRKGWPGFGTIGEPGPLGDSWRLFHEPVALAEELVGLGYSGLKVWPFDQAAIEYGSALIPYRVIEAATQPLRDIRDKVGMDLDILVDGHAHFQLPPEPDADFGERDAIEPCGLQLGIDEPSRGLRNDRPDLGWGISETVRIAHLAETYNVPVSMHDCTGPLTLFAGLHVGAAVANCCYQETVRAQIQTVYKELIDVDVEVEIDDGFVGLPQGTGLGVRLNPDLFKLKRPGYRISKF